MVSPSQKLLLRNINLNRSTVEVERGIIFSVFFSGIFHRAVFFRRVRSTVNKDQPDKPDF